MNGELIAFVAVVMSLGIPLGAMYLYYRVRKLRTEERLAALARGVEIPMAAEPSQASRSRRAGIILIAGALGFMAALGSTAAIEHEPEVWAGAAFGFIPLAVGIGYFVDFTLLRREARS